MRKNASWVIAVMLMLSLVLTACSGRTQGSSQTFSMKVGNDTAQDIQEEITFEFAKQVEKLTGGKIKASAHSAGSLGNNGELAKGLQSGSVEAMVAPTGFVTQFLPELGVLDLPFALPADIKGMTDAVNGPIGTKLKEAAEKKGFRLIALFGIGPVNFVTAYPVKTAEDLKGKKFRVAPAPERIGTYKDWNALAVGMQFAEVFTSLQQGTIHGLELPPDITFKMKMYEAAPYYTVSGHNVYIEFIGVSKKWYDQLPKELQQLVDKAGVEAANFGVKRYTEGQAAGLAEMKKLPKVTVSDLPEAERNKLRQTSLNGIWKEIANDPVKGPFAKLLQESQK